MVGLRFVVILLAGFTLFSDEQERFVCNTIQPGCSNVCFDLFSPLSLLRLWLLQLLLLCLPHMMFGTYIMHKVLSHPSFGTYYCNRSQGCCPYARETSSSSRETSLYKAPLCDLPPEWPTPTFHCAYFLVVVVRILLEMAFCTGQLFVFGFSMQRSFLCYEAPCTSGVECYISRPTEKTLMLNFMLGVSSLSILLSVVDMTSSIKMMVSQQRKREKLMEEMSRGEQTSVFTSTSGAEDTEVLLTKRAVPNGHLKNDIKDGKDGKVNDAPCDVTPHVKLNGGTDIKAADGRSSECKDAKVEVPRSPTSMGTLVPTHFVLHSHLKPLLSPRQDRGGLPDPVAPTPVGIRTVGQYSPVGTGSGHQSDSSKAQDKRAWVWHLRLSHLVKIEQSQFNGVLP